MAITNKPTSELLREMYARFGLAYYHSEVLHRGLCIILAMSDLPRREMITQPRIEEQLARAFTLTLGEVITKLSGKILNEYSLKLEEAREKRNFLAHNFWFDRAHLMFRADQVHQLIIELDSYAELFNQLDEQISHWFQSKLRELGVTDKILQDSLNSILLGKNKKSLPSKDVVKEREKKLSQKQRIIHVWEFDLPEGGKPLVFEMQDGSLWQLCDIGLGWTRFQKIEPHWVKNSAIEPYLPADIMPRPKSIEPWEYEFELRNRTVLWVKPGKYPSTFKWGIKTREAKKTIE